jgi:hypothetical protein
VYLSGHGEPRSVEGRFEDEASSSLEAVVERLAAKSVLETPLSRFSFGVGGTGLPFVALLKSKAVPAVLGVLPEDPNDANAPDPRPKAEDADAPEVGDDMPDVLKGEMALKGFRLPSAPPKRFEFGKVREVGWSLREDSL